MMVTEKWEAITIEAQKEVYIRRITPLVTYKTRVREQFSLILANLPC